MAGDWIKVERATLHKPEVLEAAELLGMDRRKALGLFLDYFAWLDENMPDSCNGFVTHVSRKSVDEALHEPGFASVLEHIGWAKFDDKARTLTVINPERHNGSTAKTRALASDRQKRFRNATVTQSPLPEKRREEITTRSRTNTKAARNPAAPIPEAFGISEGVRAWGVNNGFGDLLPYLETFISRNTASGKKYVNWDQAFMNAVREDWYELRKPSGHSGSGRESRISEQERVLDALTGKRKGRTIEPTD